MLSLDTQNLSLTFIVWFWEDMIDGMCTLNSNSLYLLFTPIIPPNIPHIIPDIIIIIDGVVSEKF